MRYISGAGTGVTAVLLDHADGLGKFINGTRQDCDLGSRCCQGLGNGPANAASAAGDQCGLAAKKG
jgi:hypothetical protein